MWGGGVGSDLLREESKTHAADCKLHPHFHRNQIHSAPVCNTTERISQWVLHTPAARGDQTGKFTILDYFFASSSILLIVGD